MLGLVVFSLPLRMCVPFAIYIGEYQTISSDKNLQDLFMNNHTAGRIEWETKNRLRGNGYPNYTVNCAGNPNWALSTHDNVLEIPDIQYIDETSYSLTMGSIGYALNGVPIFNAASAEDEDAFTAEGSTFDGCGAHTATRGAYHYHIVPGSTNPKIQGDANCFPQIKVPGLPGGALGTIYFQGVALDGFPIFVTINNGQVVLEPDLDECGGKEYDEYRYAYFIRPTFPYTLGCFKGQIQNTNRGPMSNIQQCYGAAGVYSSSYMWYFSMRNGLTETNCLPSSGQSQQNCVVGAAANWQLNGQCLDVKPTDYVGTSSTGTSGSGQPNQQGGGRGGWGQPGGCRGGGRGRPNQQGGMGGPWGQPNQQGGMGPNQPGIWGQPNQQGGMGPNQPGIWGQPNQQGGMGPDQPGVWGQPNQQGGMGPNQPGVWGQPNQQGGMGPNRPGVWGQPNQQGGMGPNLSGGWGTPQAGGRGGHGCRGGRGRRGRGGRERGRRGAGRGRGSRPGGFVRRTLEELLDRF